MTSKIAKYPFTVRAHDIDFSGLTSPSGLCRILESSRWHLILPGGMLEKFVQQGVVRSQYIEILKKVGFGHKIEVETWISRIGGTSFDIGSTIRSVKDQSIIARSAVTFISTDGHGRPCQVDKTLHEFLVEQDSVTVPRIQRKLNEDAWSDTFEIKKSDQDLLQHMNQARYIDYIENARFSCMQTNGYGEKKEMAAGSVNKLTISYENQGLVGDLMRIYTWPVTDASNQLAFEIRRDIDNSTITRAEITIS